jgi:hypothetical protein
LERPINPYEGNVFNAQNKVQRKSNSIEMGLSVLEKLTYMLFKLFGNSFIEI